MRVGMQLDERYELLAEVGAGGMAVVWRALDHRLGVERAIKVMSAEFRGSDALMARFEREARLMARLENPHIAPVHDIVVGEHAYIVMSLFRGGSLRDHLAANGALSGRQTIAILLPLLDALDTAHSHGVVHRDVKPHNVLLDVRGRPRLTDFGIASDGADLGLTRTGAVMGTWTYMAPEQRSSAKGIDGRADLYALGAMTAEMLLGESVGDLHAAEGHAVLEPLVPSLRAFVVRCTRYHAADRFPSAAAAASALRAILVELPDDDDPPRGNRPAPATSSDPEESGGTHDTVVAWMDSQATTEPSTWVDTTPPVSAIEPVQPTVPQAARAPRTTEVHPVVPIVASAGLVVVVLGLALLYGLQGDPPTPLRDVGVAGGAMPKPVDGAVEASGPVGGPAPADPPVAAVVQPVAPVVQPMPMVAVAPRPITRPEGRAEPAPDPDRAPDPPPSPEPREVGRLRVASQPADATVQVDGVVVGTATLTVEVEPGEHWVTVAHPEHESIRRQVVVTPGALARLCWDFVEGARCR